MTSSKKDCVRAIPGISHQLPY